MLKWSNKKTWKICFPIKIKTQPHDVIGTNQKRTYSSHILYKKRKQISSGSTTFTYKTRGMVSKGYTEGFRRF